MEKSADTNYKVYEDYLDSKVTSMDLFYLKSRALARKLVEHGHKGTVVNREEFEDKSASQAAETVKNNTLFYRSRPVTLSCAGKELRDDFLKALAEREEANRSGRMNSLVFIRDQNPRGQEVSGYIDLAHRLRSQDFDIYFSGKKKLMPGRSDLWSYGTAREAGPSEVTTTGKHRCPRPTPVQTLR
ncbi:cilia- and flagella-associated protein 299 isoform X2 [Solea solea]|uniref:cilia- and flagella-associated protein 299 isoform X2 n=1 Tax=Solea solea TaxID=90069 RepID=UPI00272CDFD4|nr:cilia- and flagella-associated protein 299 isoform X2 [Solea solea]